MGLNPGSPSTKILPKLPLCACFLAGKTGMYTYHTGLPCHQRSSFAEEGHKAWRTVPGRLLTICQAPPTSLPWLLTPSWF